MPEEFNHNHNNETFGRIADLKVSPLEYYKLVGDFKVGDTIHVKGATTDFEQVVESMQLDKVAVNEAKVGDEIAIKVSDRVRQDDIVYKK